MNAEFDSDDFLTRLDFHDGCLKGMMLEANEDAERAARVS